MASPTRVLVVTGATAVGKTAVVSQLVRKLPIEVISADSVQVYRGMDIGTAKPTAEEQAEIPHRLIDIVSPGGRCRSRWVVDGFFFFFFFFFAGKPLSQKAG